MPPQSNAAGKRPAISAGLGHSAVATDKGELLVWGASRQFQLGLDRITDKERRNGKTEEDLPPPEDKHMPYPVPTLGTRPGASGDKIVSVAAGSSHTLAVTSQGAVFSWGNGAFGKLGHDDGNNDVRIPKQVELKRKRIARIACGADFSAALSESGEVLTWGAGSYGNLGHGDNGDQPRPKLVDALVGKRCVSVSCGSKHTLALTQAGGHVYAWGYGGGGRLGCGDSRGQFRPKLVEALRELPCMLVAAGDSHSMALTTDKGHLYTWGLGDYGKLGHGDTTPALNPRHLEFFRAERLVWAAGGSFHSAAVVELTGLVYTWGGGSYGKLGQGDTMNSLTPRPIKAISAGAHFAQVECGPFHTLALTKLGDVWAWGFNGNGRLGLADAGASDTKQRLTPVLLKSIEGAAVKDEEHVGLPTDDASLATSALVKALRPKQIKGLALGGFHSGALSDQGDVYCFGDGRAGATGVDLSKEEEKEVPRPQRVLHLGGARNTVVVLAAGVKHMLAVTGDGKLYSWGEGTNGRLGHGDQTTVAEPRLLSSLKGKMVVAAAAGEEHSLAAASDGEMFAWGSGSFGKLGLGDPTDESTPRPVTAAAGHHVTAVACGYAHSVALCANYEVLVWGSGWKGKLGLGDNQNRATPTPIQMLKRKHVLQVACGSFHTLALAESGDIFTWGIGERGQLGHGDLENRKVPTPILELQGREVGWVAGGEAHSLACSRDGDSVWSWGAGHYGQLGIGGLDARLAPTEVEELAGKKVTQVACGTNHSGCVAMQASAVATGATVYMWGNGSNSRLGNGESSEQETPVMILALTSTALTEPGGGGEGGDAAEPSRLLTPAMMRQLHGTDIDAATAQQVLDDPSNLRDRARQADTDMERSRNADAMGLQQEMQVTGR